jgi:ABC-type polysaccharide/polyol phosphate export permease
VIEAVEPQPGRLATAGRELAKLPAFARRDMLVAWSYRATFISDVLSLFLQALLFYFVGLLVDEGRLPEFGGSPVTYMEYVTVGIALAAFLQIGLGRVAAALRQEQMIGTLESLLATPTSPSTIQLGSVLYDLIYVPIRTGLFLMLIAVGFGLDFNLAGVPPAALVILFFVPFVWGLGLVTAAATLTFRGGSAGVGFGLTIMTLASGAFFPLALLPGGMESLASFNPMAIAIEGMRDPLLGVVDWSETLYGLAVLVPFSAVSLAVGIYAFRAALRRERRRGTIGHY